MIRGRGPAGEKGQDYLYEPWRLELRSGQAEKLADGGANIIVGSIE